jgi:K+/H+ antiporter YhaU regulatory subunit KhtT
MMKGFAIALTMILACALLLSAVFERSIKAQETSFESEIAAKLDEVVSGQKKVLEEIAAIKEELKIIKVRVTMMSS